MNYVRRQISGVEEVRYGATSCRRRRTAGAVREELTAAQRGGGRVVNSDYALKRDSGRRQHQEYGRESATDTVI